MAIEHKFKEWLTLPDNLVTWEVEKLIIGPFNADINTNEASWFYGNTNRNHLWQILPELMREESLIRGSQSEWIEFCKKHKIAFTDLVTNFPNADSINSYDKY
jgi:hypothetical protein